MFGNAPTFSQREVSAPPDRRCGSGHPVPPDQEFQGHPTKWFSISGPGVEGVVCEPCLTVAHAMAREKRKHVQSR